MRQPHPPQPHTTMTTQTALGPFEYRFTPSLSFIRLARHALAGWLQAQPEIDVDGADDLLIACSELCTNAIESAGPTGSVAMRACVDGDAVMLEVEDDGDGGDTEWRTAPHNQRDLHAEHGRGLFIVDRLTDSLDIEVGGGRTIVGCRKAGMLSHPGDTSDAGWSARFQR